MTFWINTKLGRAVSQPAMVPGGSSRESVDFLLLLIDRLVGLTLTLTMALVLLGGAGAALFPVESSARSVSDCVDQRSSEPRWSRDGIPIFGYRVVKKLPHDPSAFTQGLLVHEGILYESTGHYGASQLRQLDLQTGAVVRARDLPGHYFGEGLARVKGRLIQLTWRERVALIYNASNLQPIASLRYPREGWGITSHGWLLFATDGSARLFHLDGHDLSLLRVVTVADGCGDIHWLNELEYIDGKVYANIWKSDFIAIINPQTGAVEGWIDLTNLLESNWQGSRPGVLNGIAFEKDRDQLWVTGKNWPYLYQVEPIRPQ